MKSYAFTSCIARIFLVAHFCAFSYSSAMELSPTVQQQIINAPQVRSALQEVQRDSARATWQGKTVDIKQALAQSKKFQSALSTAIDAEYKKLLTVTEQIAQTGSQEAAKTAAKKALKKIKEEKPSSFSRYAKIAAIAALAAVVVAYGGVSLREQQSSSVEPWTHKGAPAPAVMSPQGAFSNVSLPSPTAGVVSPAIRELVQQGGGEGTPAPKTPAILEELYKVVGDSGALFIHKESSKTLEAALADLIKIQGKQSQEQLLLVDKVDDFRQVLFWTVDSNIATPNNKHGWVCYSSSDEFYLPLHSNVYCAKWNYKFDPNAWFNKETFKIGEEQKLMTSSAAEYKEYSSLFYSLRIKLPAYNINQNISSKFVAELFEPLQGVDPIKQLSRFTDSLVVLLKSYERAFAQSSFNEMFSSVFEPRRIYACYGDNCYEDLYDNKYTIALCDQLNGEYNEVIIAVYPSFYLCVNYHGPKGRAGWMYYTKSDKIYFMEFFMKFFDYTTEQKQRNPTTNPVVFEPGEAIEVTDLEEIGRYKKLYKALKSHGGKSFKFSELPFEKIYGTK